MGSRLACCLLSLLFLLGVQQPALAGLDLTGGYLDVLKAVQSNDIGSLRDQVLRGDDVNHQDDLGRTALVYAAIAGSDTMVKLLLEGHARTSIRDRDGRVALHWAVQKDNPEAVAALLDGGAEPDTLDPHGTTALMMAAANGNVGVVRVLIQHHARVDLRDYTGRSALDFATAGRQPQIVQALKRAGAS